MVVLLIRLVSTSTSVAVGAQVTVLPARTRHHPGASSMCDACVRAHPPCRPLDFEVVQAERTLRRAMVRDGLRPRMGYQLAR